MKSFFFFLIILAQPLFDCEGLDQYISWLQKRLIEEQRFALFTDFDESHLYRSEAFLECLEHAVKKQQELLHQLHEQNDSCIQVD